MGELLTNNWEEVERLKRISEKYRNDGIKMGVYLEDDQVREFHLYRNNPIYEDCTDFELMYILLTPAQREAFDAKRNSFYK
jgi:hypothetical protein